MRCLAMKNVEDEKADLNPRTSLRLEAAVFVHQQHKAVYSLGILLLQ